MELETFIDKIKINKYAESIAIFYTYGLVATTNDVLTKHDLDLSNGLKLLIGTLGLGISVYLARKQNKRYKGILDGIEKHGYDERFCSIYMDHPCGRSVVKTALKRTKNFDNYNNLKMKYPLTRVM